MTIYSIFGILGLVAAALTGIRYFIRRPANLFVSFVQHFVGVIFIFSGFIKANDPLGFGYKLEEYYGVFAEATQYEETTTASVSIGNKPLNNAGAAADSLSGTNSSNGSTSTTVKKRDSILSSFFGWMKGSSVFQSILICIFEMLVGFMLIIGARKKLVLWLLSLMVVFFTFLTFYSAYFNKVTDCGCFGDFMHLTPWQSFKKDLFLLGLTVILILGRKKIEPVFTSATELVSIGVFAIVCTWIPVHTWNSLPFFDFRPYKVGTDIVAGMKTPPGGEGKFESLLYYKNLKSGEVKEFTTKNYPWQDTLNWKYDTAITKTIVEPVLAPIHDFNISNADGENYTEDLLAQPGPKFFLICRDLQETNRKVFGQVNDLAELCKKDNVPFICLTSSSEQIESFKKETGATFDFYLTDGTQLKTMIRSNPGLILLDGPVVKAMWPGSGLPSYNDVKEKYFKK